MKQKQLSNLNPPKPEFHNGDLSFDIEKILDYDEVEFKKDVIDNDGEPSYYLDVNDTGYSYGNVYNRNKDCKVLIEFLRAHNKNLLIKK